MTALSSDPIVLPARPSTARMLDEMAEAPDTAGALMKSRKPATS